MAQMKKPAVKIIGAKPGVKKVLPKIQGRYYKNTWLAGRKRNTVNNDSSMDT